MGVAGSNRRGGGTGSSGASKGSSFKVTIPSDFDAARDVQERILRDVEQYGYTDESTFALRIALEEAMVNAIKHGNGLDPDKKVHVESKVTPRRVEILVEDEGPGFDRSNIPDPTHDDNLHKPSGRGILLIEAYMDSAQWSKGGRKLRMVKENG
jgi:serine/threonine-protein kinase RsbW